MRHLFIINPISGAPSVRSRLQQSLAAYQNQHPGLLEIAYVHSADDFRSTIRNAIADPSPLRLYVCGGDGTINQAVQLIVGHPHVELAAIPLGTGNDFLRNFKNEAAFFDIHALVNGHPIPTDVIRVGDKYSINIANAGFDCHVVANVEKLRKQLRHLRMFAYTIGVLITLVKRPTVNLKLTMEDGTVREGEYLVFLFANGCYYGGGYNPAPMARIDDGIMDMVAIRPVSRLKFLSLLSSYKKGTLFENRRAWPYIEHHSIRKAVITAEDPFIISLDGEIHTIQNAEVEVLPETVRFVLPSTIQYT